MNAPDEDSAISRKACRWPRGVWWRRSGRLPFAIALAAATPSATKMQHRL